MRASSVKVLLLVFFFCTVFVTAAVGDPAEARLHGSWTQEGAAPVVWTFRPDGSGFMEQTEPRTTARFTWDCRGQRLNVSTAGLSVPYTVVSNDGRSLVLRNEQLATVLKLKKKS